MLRFNRLLLCAAVAAVAFSASHPAAQAPAFPEEGRSVPIHSAGATLTAGLALVDTMLRQGDLDIARTQTDSQIRGRVHERLKQMYKGVPVFGSEVVRQMDGRSFISLSGRLYDNIDLDVTPQISAESAADVAVQAAGENGSIKVEPVLGVLPVSGGGYILAYKMQTRSNWDIRDVAIDASTGQLIYSRSLLESINTIAKGTGVLGDPKKMSVSSTNSNNQAIDNLRKAPLFTLDFRGSLGRLNSFIATGLLFNSDVATDSDNVWTDGPTVDAHVYQGWVYDYYFKRHGRQGIDDKNLEIDGIVHPVDRSQSSRQSSDFVNTYINNAFFCCDGLMVYGDGDGTRFTYMAGALDVVGHEMSHGVTQYSSNLTYQDEPGALNEAFSDIMGASIEFFFQPQGTGTEKSDWLIGEDVSLRSPFYIRSLANPNSVGDPDHYTLRRFIGTTTDNGGVHTNMNIVTHAFYLAVAGGRNRVSGINVTGVGMANIDHMEKIFYRGFVFLLSANAQFSDARAATLQAATDLYGGSSNDRAQLLAAWNAVGVN